jgi:hypothetical protein
MATTWTDPVLTPLTTKVKSVHVAELRTAVNTAEGNIATAQTDIASLKTLSLIHI